MLLSNQLPIFNPRQTENRLFSLSAKVVVDNNLLFVELFNKSRIPIEPTRKDSHFTVKVFQNNDTELVCFIDKQEFCKAAGIHSKKVAILLKRDHLGLYLECMREFPAVSESQLDQHLQNKIAEKIKKATSGLIKKKDFCFLQKECQRIDHQKKWSDELSQAKKNNKRLTYIVLSLMTPQGKRFKIEYRGYTNFHLRLKKHIKKGSANLISLHADLFSGELIAKNKLLLNDRGFNPFHRYYHRSAFIEMAQHAMTLNDIPGVIPFVKAHEFSADGSKGYFFTKYCTEGDFFEHIMNHVYPNTLMFSWLRDLSLALDAIHQKGLIHRDIKPENILITTQEGKHKIYIGDLEFTEELSSAASVKKGTLAYLAPELIKCVTKNIIQCNNRPTIDSYALGIVVFMSLFKNEMPWSQDLRDQNFKTALDKMKVIAWHPEIARLDKRLSKVLLGLLSYDSNLRMSLKEAAEIFDDIYRNSPY